MEQTDNPTHKHTHLQAAQSQRTNQSLQKSVLLANAQPTRYNQTTDELGQQITAVWQEWQETASYEHLC